MQPEQSAGPQDNAREIKKQRYRDRAFVAQYDTRYTGGLNAVSTLVESGWVIRRAAGLTLDCGAGTGRFSLPLAQSGLAVIALDSSTGMLAELRAKAPLPCTAGDIFRLPLRDHSVDSLICLHLLFHLPDWRAALAGFARVLRPGGQLLFEMRSGEHVALARRALRLVGRSGPPSAADRGGATVHATRHEVAGALEHCGLRLEAHLNYDLGHAYYLAPLSPLLDRVLGGSRGLRAGLAALERTAGPFLPAALTYRTLYAAVKR